MNGGKQSNSLPIEGSTTGGEEVILDPEAMEEIQEWKHPFKVVMDQYGFPCFKKHEEKFDSFEGKPVKICRWIMARKLEDQIDPDHVHNLDLWDVSTGSNKTQREIGVWLNKGFYFHIRHKDGDKLNLCVKNLSYEKRASLTKNSSSINPRYEWEDIQFFS